MLINAWGPIPRLSDQLRSYEDRRGGRRVTRSHAAKTPRGQPDSPTRSLGRPHLATVFRQDRLGKARFGRAAFGKTYEASTSSQAGGVETIPAMARDVLMHTKGRTFLENNKSSPVLSRHSRVGHTTILNSSLLNRPWWAWNLSSPTRFVP